MSEVRIGAHSLVARASDIALTPAEGGGQPWPVPKAR